MPFVDYVKIDTLHDFYLLGYKQFIRFIPTHATSVYLLLTGAVASLSILLYRYRSKVWRQLSTTPRYPPFFLVLIIVVFLVFSLLIDSKIILESLHISKYDPLGLVVYPLLKMLEEMLEMNAGIGLLFCSLSLYDSGSSQKQIKKTVASAVVETTDGLVSSQRWIGVAAAGVVVFVFWILIWYQGRLYEDTEMLRRDNVAKSPGSWAFHYAQGNILSESGELKKAIKHYRKALKYSAGNSAVHINLGNALVRQDDLDEAIEHFRQALLIQPEFAEAHESLGNALTLQGKRDEAVKHYEKALRIMKSRREASAPR